MARHRYIGVPGGGWQEVSADYIPSPSNQGVMVMPDLTPYINVHGQPVEGRRQHREFLRQHGYIEVGNEKPKPFKPDFKPRDLRGSLNAAWDQLSRR
jgi:hypothetical protein